MAERARDRSQQRPPPDFSRTFVEQHPPLRPQLRGRPRGAPLPAPLPPPAAGHGARSGIGMLTSGRMGFGPIASARSSAARRPSCDSRRRAGGCPMTSLPLLPRLLHERQRPGVRGVARRRSAPNWASSSRRSTTGTAAARPSTSPSARPGAYALVGRNLALAEKPEQRQPDARRSLQRLLPQPRQDRPVRAREPGPARPGQRGPRGGRPAVHAGLGRGAPPLRGPRATTSASRRSAAMSPARWPACASRRTSAAW